MKNKITIVKKYANRRLYDTGKSSYVTLTDLADMVREDIDFKIIDAKSEKDLTQSILMQIIVDQEAKENTPNLLPKSFLKEIIKFHGGSMEAFVPTYLRQAMQNFAQSQTKMQEQMEKSFGSLMPTGSMPSTDQIEEITKQNIEMIQQTMKMLNPFESTENQDKKDR